MKPLLRLRHPKELLDDESGATAIEYGLILLIVALGIIASLSTLATNLSSIFSNFATHLN